MVDEEFDALDLGDFRRDRRARELLKRFAAKPTGSIPGACDGWTETMATYRFLGNEEVEWVDMMQPHWERTAARMQQHAVVPCIADTTGLDFNGQDIAQHNTAHPVSGVTADPGYFVSDFAGERPLREYSQVYRQYDMVLTAFLHRALRSSAFPLKKY